MKNKWSSHWKSSKQPRKQRKYVYNAPLHVLRNFFSAHLSKELRQKYTKRNIPLRKGDKVKIMSGQFKGKTGSITKVLLKRRKVIIDGIKQIRKTGEAVPYMIHPSNLMITELNLDDKLRKKALEKK